VLLFIVVTGDPNKYMNNAVQHSFECGNRSSASAPQTILFMIRKELRWKDGVEIWNVEKLQVIAVQHDTNKQFIEIVCDVYS
jgi:hypothetical protein